MTINTYAEVVTEVIDEVLDRHILTVNGLAFLASRIAPSEAVKLLEKEIREAAFTEMFSEVAMGLLFRTRGAN